MLIFKRPGFIAITCNYNRAPSYLAAAAPLLLHTNPHTQMATPPTKSLQLAKTILTRTSSILEQRKPQTPLIAPPPLSRYHSPCLTRPAAAAPPTPHFLATHSSWPRSRPFPAPARVHSDTSAFGRHYATFAAAHPHPHSHPCLPQQHQHQCHPVRPLTRFALGARAFGMSLAPEIKRLGVGLSSQCGTPLCRQIRTIFSEKGGFDYW